MEKASAASPALARLLAAEQAALATLSSDDALAGRFQTDIAGVQRTIASVEVDPLSQKLMSPSATVVPAAHRAGAEARKLAAVYCATS